MATVTILEYREYTHRASGTVFLPALVQTEAGPLYRGRAEVADDVARAHFVGHPAFRVEGLGPDPADAARLAAEKAADAAKAKGKTA